MICASSTVNPTPTTYTDVWTVYHVMSVFGFTSYRVLILNLPTQAGTARLSYPNPNTTSMYAG